MIIEFRDIFHVVAKINWSPYKLTLTSECGSRTTQITRWEESIPSLTPTRGFFLTDIGLGAFKFLALTLCTWSSNAAISSAAAGP